MDLSEEVANDSGHAVGSPGVLWSPPADGPRNGKRRDAFVVGGRADLPWSQPEKAESP